jgi:hypothetical protein
LSHGTGSYIRKSIKAFADSLMLYLQHDFYNIILKIKLKLYIASGKRPPRPPSPHGEILGVQLKMKDVKAIEIHNFFKRYLSLG